MQSLGVLGWPDCAGVARCNHWGSRHPHLSSWISSRCSQRTSVWPWLGRWRWSWRGVNNNNKLLPLLASILLTLKYMWSRWDCWHITKHSLKVCGCHRQLHRDLDGVRCLLDQRGLPQPSPRNLPQVRVQGPHPYGGTSINQYSLRQNVFAFLLNHTTPNEKIVNFEGSNADFVIFIALCGVLGWLKPWRHLFSLSLASRRRSYCSETSLKVVIWQISIF